ncbi:unnamed protein product [marine sediment metagenome]|uniref:Uncharacterized protein n=1 Tax=marine sediment metagenome TaxID=412755 RepID=X1ALY4_9ZZZZ
MILVVIAIIAAIYLYNPNIFSNLLTPPSAQIKGLTVTDAYEGKLDLAWNPSTEPDLDHRDLLEGRRNCAGTRARTRKGPSIGAR